MDFIIRNLDSIDSWGLELKLLPSQSRSTWLFPISQLMVFTETDGGSQMPEHKRKTLQGRRKKVTTGCVVGVGGVWEISGSLSFISNVWRDVNLWMWPRFSILKVCKIGVFGCVPYRGGLIMKQEKKLKNTCYNGCHTNTAILKRSGEVSAMDKAKLMHSWGRDDVWALQA